MKFKSFGISLAANVGALAVGLAVTALIVWSQDRSIGTAMGALFDGSLGTAFARGNSLNKMAALLLVACGFIVAKRAGLISIGGEGQIFMGGLFSVTVVLALDGQVPDAMALVLGVLAGAVGGGFWGFIAGVLRVRFGINEVIGTLMLNFIAIFFVGWTVQEEWLLRETVTSTASEPQSRQIPEGLRLPTLGIESGNQAHAGVAVALLAAFGLRFLLRRTVLGYRIRLLGSNPAMAVRSGVSPERLTMGVMAMSGAFCGLAGTSLILGEQFRLRDDVSPGFGFDGIAVALLARDGPIGSIASALVFGGLRAGGNLLEIRSQISSSLVLVVQGVIILAVASTTRWVKSRTDALAISEHASTTVVPDGSSEPADVDLADENLALVTEGSDRSPDRTITPVEVTK